jgi:hypothetical protein
VTPIDVSIGLFPRRVDFAIPRVENIILRI